MRENGSFVVIGFNKVDILFVFCWFDIDSTSGHGTNLSGTVAISIILHAQDSYECGLENLIL